MGPFEASVAVAFVLCAFGALNPRNRIRDRIVAALLTIISGAVLWRMIM
jgi:hypothetical protein